MSIYSAFLRSVVADAVQTLLNFATGPLFAEKFALVFGTPAPSLATFRSALAQLPEVEVLADEVLDGTAGAFSAQTGKIYLSESVVNGDPALLQAVLFEEVGHYLDSVFNTEDTPGDEGAIFAALVQDQDLSKSQLAGLRAEADWATVMIDGQLTALEIANFTGTARDDVIDAFPTGGATLGTQQTAILNIVDNELLIFADNFDNGISPLWGNEVGNWQQTQGVYDAQNPNNSPLTYSSLPYFFKRFFY